jgi:phage minor structural protein
MQIYNDSRARIGMLTGYKERAIVSTLNSGDKELSFQYPATGAMVDLLKEEYYIRTKTDEYVLKAVEKGENYNTYTATLNVEELEGQQFPYGFASEEQTIRACLEFAFDGTPWIIGTCTVTKKRTIDIEDAATAWDVLQSCLSTYRCECQIDSINKKIDIYEQIGNDRGCYFVEGMNLRKLTINSDTYEFYTRIIPLGKDGITIELLVGKNYLENYQYSQKVKTYTWKDERYTNTTSLKEDAEAKLDEMSKPYRVFAADIVDLAKQNPEYSNILDYGIGDTIQMVSKKTRTQEKQRIVKITEYPETPQKNTVELSNTTKTFAEVQKTETELAKTEAISISNSNTKKVLTNYSTTEEVESKITASEEAIELSVSQTLTSYYNKTETDAAIKVSHDEISLGVMNTLTNYYDKTETDAAIKVSQDEITLGVSQVYQTKDAMSNYSTTAETTSLIDISIDAITLETTNGESSSTITLKAGETVLASEEIVLSGMVLFSDLSDSGKTQINGANILTGIIKDKSGNTQWNLDTGAIQSKKFSIDSTNFDLTEAGILTAKGATLTNATIQNGSIVQETSTVKLTITGGELSGGYKGEYQNYIDFSNRVGSNSALSISGEFGIQLRSPRIFVATETNPTTVTQAFTGSRGGYNYINGLMV